MGNIIVIDGTSNAGKTTLCENIEKNIQNIAIVPGASLFAKINRKIYNISDNSNNSCRNDFIHV